MKRKLASILMGLLAVCLLAIQPVFAQNKTVKGKVTDAKDGSSVAGASVTVKGTALGAQTDSDGVFSLSVPANAKTLVISSVGFASKEVSIGTGAINVSLEAATATDLNEVIVVGYGTARKKDLTGSVASVKAKDFNQGAIVSPEQLIQGKVSGVLIVANNGAPGAGATIRIRGNNSIRAGSQPLFVLDGVALDGRSGKPGLNATGFGNTPTTNPLNFINPDDIASIDVLKDASASAIYGSRGANGVILITTQRGKAGRTSLDIGASVGISNIARQLETLNGNEYRQVLTDYGLQKGNYGGNLNAMDAITRTGITQNYSAALSGGSESARFRVAIGSFDQQGIVEKSDLKKYTFSAMSNFKFLDSKKLGLDLSLFGTQLKENTPLITNDAGAQGNLTIAALQWNPTLSLYNSDGTIRTYLTDANVSKATINPLTLSRYYNDISDMLKVFVVASPYYTFNKNFEYRANVSLNQETGKRRAWMSRLVNIEGVEGQGWANLSEATLRNFLFNNTLTYKQDITKDLNLNAVVGYEYQNFNYRSSSNLYRGFGIDDADYTNMIGAAAQANQSERNSFEDPTAELQSYFARTAFNLKDKYLLTATVRVDGSSKFGENKKYGTFPSFAAAWNINSEGFLASSKVISLLKLRVGWGMVGNQDFPSGAAQERYALTTGGGARLVNAANPDLKWESSTTTNVGFDFGLFKNRLSGSVDYFYKNTNDLLFNFEVIQPAPPGSRIWQNLDGTIVNSGVEVSLNYNVINRKDFGLDLGINSTFLKNEFKDYKGPQILTGGVHGQGVSGASVQQMVNGLPLNAFYTRKWNGLDANGFNIFDKDEALQYVGNPNPKTLLGVTTDLRYKKLSFRTSWNGAFGHVIYNNTLNSVLNVSNLNSEKNLSRVFTQSGGPREALTNISSPSSRYLEKGDYFRFTNFTVGYDLGAMGKTIKNLRLSLTGQNLVVFTKFSGFDPEVNTDKQINGVSSFGIEYAPYPSARNFLLSARVSF